METSTDSATGGAATNGTSSEATAGTRRKLSDQQEAEVTRLYAETDTPVSEISKRFGIGESSVYRVAQRHGAALRGRTATSSTPKPRAAAAEGAPAAAGRTPGRRGRAPGAGRAAASAAGAATTPTGNGRRTGARGRAAQAATGRPTPAAAPAASGGTREFRVSYTAIRVFIAVDMADAIQQAEAAGATDITGIVRGD